MIIHDNEGIRMQGEHSLWKPIGELDIETLLIGVDTNYLRIVTCLPTVDGEVYC